MEAFMRYVVAFVSIMLSLPVMGGEFSRQPAPVGEPTDPVELLLPHTGGWWNPDAGGSGYFIETIRNPDGTMLGFGTIYTYNTDGTSTFLIVQGPVTFSTESQRIETGIIARFSSQIFKAANGQPFGGPYRPAQVTPAGLGEGEFVFFTRRSGEFRTADRSVPIRVVSSASAEQEVVSMLTGTWTLKARLRFPEAYYGVAGPALSNTFLERYVSHTVRIEKSVVQPQWTASVSGPALTSPNNSTRGLYWRPRENTTNGIVTFTVTCVEDCPPTGGLKFSATYGARIWVDLNTGKAGYVTRAIPPDSPTGNGFAYWATAEEAWPGHIDLGNFTFDLFLDDQTVIGRGGFLTAMGQAWPAGFTQGSELVLTKVNPNLARGNVRNY
jgi:hypothetical protein